MAADMTTRDDLVERVAQVLYEKARAEFHTDPATVSCGPDFADDIFPPWEAIDEKGRWYSDARAAIAIALEEAAKKCDPQGICTEMDAYGAYYAAAIRAMIKD